jgi:hypothetical protein
MDLFKKSHSVNCSISEVEIESFNGKLVGHLVTWAGSDHLHGLAANQAAGVPVDGTYYQSLSSKA